MGTPQFRSPNSSSTLQLQKNESINLHHHRRHRSIRERERDENKSKKTDKTKPNLQRNDRSKRIEFFEGMSMAGRGDRLEG